MTFLCDNGLEYSYDDLLRTLNEEDYYYPYYKLSDLYSFFVNMIKALTTNKPLMLLDSDLTPPGTEGTVNVPQHTKPASFMNIDEVVAAIHDSQSDISIFTSGTTGKPKKVMHSITSLTRSVRKGAKYKGQIWAYAYQPTHMAGLQVFFQAFENQNTLVNVFRLPRENICQQIEGKKITHISATPTFYRLLLPVENTFKSVVRITLGGEKSDQRLYDSIRKAFPNATINNIYATTEAGFLLASKGDCFLIPASNKDKLKIQSNELLIHKSLLGRSDEIFKFSEDFYHSGDLIEWVDEDRGLFRFVSRKNNIINVGGYKVSPEEVEDAVMDIEGVRQALVYGKTNSILGNVLCADVVLEVGANLKEMEIRKILGIRLQDYKVPRRIRIVEEISLTRTGKVNRI